MSTLETFIQQNRASNKGKTFKVRNSFGVYDAYKYIRKQGWYNIGRPLKEGEFYAIIRGINNLLAEELLKSQEIKFPASMGRLEMIKYEVGASFKEGQLKVTYPVDWMETWKLWHRDNAAFQEKALVRHTNNWVYRIRYVKDKANYTNKQFYLFTLNSKLKKRLSQNIKNGKIDTLWLKR